MQVLKLLNGDHKSNVKNSSSMLMWDRLGN